MFKMQINMISHQTSFKISKGR